MKRLLFFFISLVFIPVLINAQIEEIDGASSSVTLTTVRTTAHDTANAVRAEMSAKAPIASPTFTGTVTIPTPFTLGAVSVLPTGTELNYVDGVTSAIQTQLNAKATNQDIVDSLANMKAGVFIVLDYGAVGDSTTDDVQEIQAAVDACALNGGGIVILPKGHFRVSTSIKLPSNVKLQGQGYFTIIENSNITFPFSSPIVTGNLGDEITGGGTSFWNEDSVAINEVYPGDSVIVLNTAGDATHFAEGDIVLLSSKERSVYYNALYVPTYNSLNVVNKVSDGKIWLRYPIQDSLSDANGDPQLRYLSGNVIGYDGEPLWLSQNAGVSNMRITQTNPYYAAYGVFACGVNNIYENLWMDDVSAIIGSNGLSNSIVRNIKGTYNMAAGDMCDLQHNNLYENIIAKRYSNLSQQPEALIGFAVVNGSDNKIKNLNIDLAHNGNVGFWDCHRCVLENSTITASEADGVTTGYGKDVSIKNNVIRNSGTNGIFIFGKRARINENSILNTGVTARGVGIVYDGTTGTGFMISNNIFGELTTAEPADSILKYATWAVPAAADGAISNNIPNLSNDARIKTIKKTIAHPGHVGTDFTWTSAENTTAQNIDLGAVIPAKARIMAIEIIVTEDLASTGGGGYMELAAGNVSAGAQFIVGASCYGVPSVRGIINPDLPATVVMNSAAATRVWINGVTSTNWSLHTAGMWTIYVTYIEYL